METERYEELRGNLRRMELDGKLAGKTLCLFGHCEASEVLAALLRERGYAIEAILDNNSAKWGKRDCVVCVSWGPCAQVVRLFGERAAVLPQSELDAAIQASIYKRDADSLIAHQDRPYVVNLHRALYVKMIPLESIYRCGVFGLPPDTKPTVPAERAGIFIGIRSGLCDILRTANCRKIALYPDYYYSDTRWKAIDMYSIDGFENIAVKDGFSWRRN